MAWSALPSGEFLGYRNVTIDAREKKGLLAFVPDSGVGYGDGQTSPYGVTMNDRLHNDSAILLSAPSEATTSPPEAPPGPHPGRRLFWKITRWTVGLGVVTAVLLFVGIKSGGAEWFWWGLAGLAAVALGLWLRRRGGFFGPHFFYDLVRLARRARSRDVRMLYGIAMLIGLGLIYWLQFPHSTLDMLLFDTQRNMSINVGARFAELFVFTVIVIQNLAVLLLTPVYVGSAIAEERERRTIDLLFTTQMKDHEILIGKLCSRLLHLGAVLLGGLPVLSLAQLWGGIDFKVLVANFVNTGMNLLTVGSVSILVSALCRKVVNAVLIIYAFVLPVTFCLGIFSLGGRSSILGLAQSDVGEGPGVLAVVLGGLGAFHGLVSVACLSVALVVVRNIRGAEDLLQPAPIAPPPPPSRRRRLRQPEEPERQLSLQIVRTYDLPPLHNDPLFWKEMNLGMNSYVYSPLFYTGLGLSIAILLLSFLAMMMGFEHRQWIERSHELGYLIRVVCILWALFCCVAVAFMSCGAIVRERQQGTLEGLLTLPIERVEILWTKWIGNFWRGWGWWVCFATTVVLGMVLTGIHVAGGLVLLAAGLIYGFFFASLGLFLSVVSKTVLSAYAKMALVLLFMLFGTWLLSEVLTTPSEQWYGYFLRIGFNPVRTWWTLAFSYQQMLTEGVSLGRQFGACLLGLALYTILGIALWLLAWWRFSKERSWRVE